MTAKNTKKISVEKTTVQDGKQETTKNWLARHLLAPVSKQEKDSDNEEMTMMEFLDRPSTAPPAGITRLPVEFTTTLEPPLARPLNKPPPRPPRPDSGVIRDVNAWLDASMIKPAPPLMAGIPYWREGSITDVGPSADVRFAMPIIRAPETERPETSHSHHIKSFCRRARKMNVRMPSLLRTKSHRVIVTQQKQATRHSTSMPRLSSPDQTTDARIPRPLNRSKSLMHIIQRSRAASPAPTSSGWLGVGQRQLLTPSPQTSGLASVRFREQESSMERRVHAVFGQVARTGTTGRPSTSGNQIPREDSMGNLSDAPTYFSGIPPPSYRSHAASIRTTSSFGCIDGMNVERRQLSQQRAVQRSRGVKGKLKKFAQKAHLTK
ncbi:uncharacterized protein BDR25DRAFT_333294 [Lindgomyces ingoldianus]|uniref:Uncharacterized protein n=1 Tax=Lindgomyces ingoldianus TaxID=673940 RepID=A0ACB6R1R5_9PLEO|nr:uncharacterized protein BDR25DRAFT_333294 [Lindgomyces ingoldianus]KAF2472452.1 hypothetical protein BDR25DRAFT_333294 [Lindgomyces ingoldianus]